jgi:hypothetical protein
VSFLRNVAGTVETTGHHFAAMNCGDDALRSSASYGTGAVIAPCQGKGAASINNRDCGMPRCRWTARSGLRKSGREKVKSRQFCEPSAQHNNIGLVVSHCYVSRVKAGSKEKSVNRLSVQKVA